MNFKNTSIAFERLSDIDLKKASLLFRFMSLPAITQIGASALGIARRFRLPVNGIIKKTLFSHFCGGESIDEVLVTAGHLASKNIQTILDYASEGKQDSHGIEKVEDKLLESINKSAVHKHISAVVLKVTGFCPENILTKVSSSLPLTKSEARQWENTQASFDKLIGHAATQNLRVMVDAEETWIQPAIDQLVLPAMLKYNQKQAIVHNTLQMYRRDGLMRLESFYGDAMAHNYFLGIKLVRGAYMEKEKQNAISQGYDSPIQPSKTACDHDFNQALQFIVKRIDNIRACVGTHNENSSKLLCSLMAEHQLPKNHGHIEFSQLLGMSDHITYNLAHHGFNVAKYVPYGPVSDVMPYLLRRAEENSAVRGQVNRELDLVNKEIQRRQETL
jgi:proline dehydrogenase